MLSEKLFRKYLRVALNHLYNRDILRASPLVDELSLGKRAYAPSALQKIITDAIEALKPAANETSYTEKRWLYDILIYRYIEQFKQEEVAHNIGVSIRQFRREQDKAIEALVYYLWEKYGLGDQKPTGQGLDRSDDQPWDRRRSAEWDWIRDARGDWVANPRQATQEMLDLIQPVAAQHAASLALLAQDSLPDLAMPPVAFRQVLLNLLRKAIDHAERGKVTLEVVSRPPFIEFRIVASTLASAAAEPPRDENNLVEIAAEMAAAAGGRMEVDEAGLPWRAVVYLPIVDGITVLVVDDNPEIVELLKRYTLGTRYRVIGLENPEQAVDLAITSGARLVVLDVMMPRIDGWELLGRLRRHPETGHLPVIVLSILAQQELALSLGAKALVMKPVKQETFLATLDQAAGELRSGTY
jgi:CheY-like chemotaxis protein